MITIEQAIQNIMDIKDMYTWSIGADEALDMAISALQAQELSETQKALDTISRQAAIDALCSVCGVDCDKSEFVYDGKQEDQVILCPEHYVLTQLPTAQPEIKPIDYQDCANAMLRMWMDEVVTDGEYNRIMDKLNAFWRTRNE